MASRRVWLTRLPGMLPPRRRSGDVPVPAPPLSTRPCQLGRVNSLASTMMCRRLFVEGGQLRAVIGDEDGEQAGRRRLAGILADEMLAARRLEEALAGLVDLGRAGRR